MTTLKEVELKIAKIDAQIAALRAQVEKVRSLERDKIIDEIRAQILEYQVTAADLQLRQRRRSSKNQETVDASKIDQPAKLDSVE